MKFFFLSFILCSLSNLAVSQTIGLIKNDQRSLNGYTLLAPTAAKESYLLDNCGRVVHQWQHLYNPGMVTYLLEDGRLLRTARIASDGFNGGGIGGRIEIYSWEGELEWGFDVASPNYHQHHDVEYMPNGNILVIAWERIPSDLVLNGGRDPEFIPENGLWPDMVFELKPIGDNDAEIVWEWHLWDHIVQDFDPNLLNYGVISEHPELFNVNFLGGNTGTGNAQSDWVHVNAIDYNPNLDQIMLCSRTMGEVWVIDHSTTTEEAASHEGGNAGKGGDFLYRWGNPSAYESGAQSTRFFYGQHDAQWIPEGLPGAGNMLIYNNNGPASALGIQSQSIEWIAPIDSNGEYQMINGRFGPETFEWFYGGGDNHIEFFSPRVSGTQRLENGNTLICDGDSGRIFEIDADEKLVWDYINPLRGSNPLNQGDDPIQNDLFRAYRYGEDYPAFEGKDLNPREVLEAMPIPSDCEIHPVSDESISLLEGLSLLSNPIHEKAVVINNGTEILDFRLFSLSGGMYVKGTLSPGQNELSLATYPQGMYILQVNNQQHSKTNIFKLIKL